MKRILFDANAIVPSLISGKTTGIGRTTIELVQQLNLLKSDLTFDLTLYTQNMKGIGGKELQTFFKTKHFYFPNRERYNKILKKFPIKELLTSYDLIHVPHNFSHLYNPKKAIVTLHDALFMKINEEAFGHLKMRQQVPKLMRDCKGIITCSESSKRDIVETMQIDPDKIDVVYWGVKHDIFFPMKKDNPSLENKPYFLSVSCNAERKNTHILVKAYLDLCKNNPENDLFLVWAQPPEFLLKLISKSKYAHRIHFVSNITDADLSRLYNNASAMIFPSSYEGFGLPILEAMACGCPVVIGRNSSLPEVGGNAVIYLKTLESKSILDTLEGFENRRYNIKKLKSEGIEQAGKFTWQKTANNYLELYKKHLALN